MGGGAWTTASATNYVTTAYSEHNVTSLDDLAHLTVNQIYASASLDPALNPKGVVRECRDSDEHPETIPVILALDVTGSMGSAAKNCAAKLNDIMENLYKDVKDVEFLMMGIGDLAYDNFPIQATQFESDVRILDQTTKIFFEGGGGGNSFESYTAAWFFGLRNTDLDCWKRGKKGIIITMGDEPLNPYLPGSMLSKSLGCSAQDISTEELYEQVKEKFNVYHIAITDREGSFEYYKDRIESSWGKLLGQHCLYGSSQELPKLIRDIVNDSTDNNSIAMPAEGISW